MYFVNGFSVKLGSLSRCLEIRECWKFCHVVTAVGCFFEKWPNLLDEEGSFYFQEVRLISWSLVIVRRVCYWAGVFPELFLKKVFRGRGVSGSWSEWKVATDVMHINRFDNKNKNNFYTTCSCEGMVLVVKTNVIVTSLDHWEAPRVPLTVAVLVIPGRWRGWVGTEVMDNKSVVLTFCM